MKDLGKILTRISDNLGKILASMARLNNLGKILVISWKDLAKISVLPRPCHDLPRSCKILQDLAKIFNLRGAPKFTFLFCLLEGALKILLV
jgi:hypothetical protein